jgi:hypothetical protein
MALTKDSTGYYLEPTTGQYYTQYTAPVYSGYNPFGMGGYMGMGGYQPQRNNGMGSMFGNNNSYTPPEGLLTVGDQMYQPFTGSAAGISQGKRSVVDALIGGRQPYEYNVPSLASLFPSMQGATQTAAMPQGNSGAGRFMNGLLGSMPTPVSTTTTQAPSSSGAGRYL